MTESRRTAASTRPAESLVTTVKCSTQAVPFIRPLCPGGRERAWLCLKEVSEACRATLERHGLAALDVARVRDLKRLLRVGAKQHDLEVLAVVAIAVLALLGRVGVRRPLLATGCLPREPYARSVSRE